MKTLASLEKELWDLFLADKYFQKNFKEITIIDNDTFPIRYKACKKEHKEIKENTKEKYVLEFLLKKNKIKKKVIIFHANKINEAEQAAVYDFNNEFIFLITPKIYENFTEYDLVPLIAHELGHIFYKTPYTPPFEYFKSIISEKLKKTSHEEYNLFFLSAFLSHINEYRADFFALDNSDNFEQIANMLIKLEDINNKKRKNFNIYKELQEGFKLYENKEFDLTDDHPHLSLRLLFLFFESTKKNLFYSKSLSDLDLKVNYDKFLDFGKSLLKG